MTSLSAQLVIVIVSTVEGGASVSCAVLIERIERFVKQRMKTS